MLVVSSYLDHLGFRRLDLSFPTTSLTLDSNSDKLVVSFNVISRDLVGAQTLGGAAKRVDFISLTSSMANASVLLGASLGVSPSDLSYAVDPTSVRVVVLEYTYTYWDAILDFLLKSILTIVGSVCALMVGKILLAWTQVLFKRYGTYLKALQVREREEW